MNTRIAIAGFLAASIAAAPAASILENTVGVINTNNKSPILEAAGNSLNVTSFASNIATAFASNTGGVWNFDGANFLVNVGETITLNYGTSAANAEVLTLSSGNNINQANTGTTEGTSGGPAGSMLGLGGDASTRTFTLSTPLLTLGIFNTDRNDASRTSSLTVTFLDNSTASTSGTNADDYYFHGLSGTAENPIVSFSLSQSNFVRYDDLGFVVVPEPSSAMCLMGGVGMFALMRRRKTVNLG